MTIIRRPAPFTLLSTGHGALIVNRNDYQMVDETRGYGVSYKLFTTSYFDPEEVETVLKMLQLRREAFGDGVVALDCGANLGVHTVEWAKTMYGWGKVIAIEAQERIYYALAGNIMLNNCFNASAIHAAVGSAKGTLNIPVPDYLQPSSFGSLELKKRSNNEFIGQQIDYSKENCQTIQQISIDSLQLERLDFIKLDIEGMEFEALAGAEESINRYSPIMLIEILKLDVPTLIAKLESYQYKMYQVGVNLLAIHQNDPCFKRIQI